MNLSYKIVDNMPKQTFKIVFIFISRGENCIKVAQLVIVGVAKRHVHRVKSVPIRSFFWSYFPVFGLSISVFGPNTGKYGPEKTPCLNTFSLVVRKNNLGRKVELKSRKPGANF